MGTAHKFVKFEKDADEPHETVYDVLNKQEAELGKIMYYSRWKKHCFEPYAETFYDTVCLKLISEFLIELDKKYPKGIIN